MRAGDQKLRFDLVWPYTVHSTGSIFYKNMFCLLVSSKPIAMEYKVWPIHSGCTDVY